MAMTETQVIGTEIERVAIKVPAMFERDSVFYANIEKRPVEVISGRDMRIPIELRPGGRFGYFNSDGGDLGRGGGPTYDKAVIGALESKFAIEWTTKSQWVTDDKRKAVIDNFRRLMAKSMAEYRRQLDSQCMTAGNGVVGVITSVTVNTPAGFDTMTLNTDGFGARLLRFGQYISVYSTDLLTKRAGGEMPIVFLDYPNKLVRIVTGTVVPQNGDKIVVSGLTATPPVGIFGVPYHHNSASTGTWLGFDRATTPEIRANRVAAGAGLSLPLPRLAVNKIGDRVGIENTGQKTTAWMHPAQFAAYEDIAQNLIFMPKEAKDEALNLYYGENRQMAGVKIRKSYSWDKTRIDFVDNDTWGRAELHPPGFYEVDGRKIFEVRATDGGLAAAMLFYLVSAFNLFIDNPAAVSYIDTLTVPSGY